MCPITLCLQDISYIEVKMLEGRPMRESSTSTVQEVKFTKNDDYLEYISYIDVLYHDNFVLLVM